MLVSRPSASPHREIPIYPQSRRHRAHHAEREQRGEQSLACRHPSSDLRGRSRVTGHLRRGRGAGHVPLCSRIGDENKPRTVVTNLRARSVPRSRGERPRRGHTHGACPRPLIQLPAYFGSVGRDTARQSRDRDGLTFHSSATQSWFRCLNAPASAEVARRMTPRQGLLAALLAFAMMWSMSAGLWVYWYLVVR